MNQSQSESIHRAAILVAALEPDLADQLLDQMPADEAARVRRAIMELGDVDVVREHDVIDAFLAQQSAPADASAGHNHQLESSAHQAADDSGVELHISSASSSQILSERTPAITSPLAFLHDVEREQLTRLLADEHPRTIALVAAHLPESLAASLLAALDPIARDEVARRFADAEGADATVLDEIAQSLAARLDESPPLRSRNPADRERISRVLTAAETESKQNLSAGAVSPEVPPLYSGAAAAGSYDPLALTFADLDHLDAELLSATLRRADPELVRLALAGGSAAFVQKVLNRLSLRDARNLRRQIETLGPTRLSDMERAQRELASLAEVVLVEALHGDYTSQSTAT